MKTNFRYKYLMSVDGNTFVSRLSRFMSSGSLMFRHVPLSLPHSPMSAGPAHGCPDTVRSAVKVSMKGADRLSSLPC